jgi:hypothetical protein
MNLTNTSVRRSLVNIGVAVAATGLLALIAAPTAAGAAPAGPATGSVVSHVVAEQGSATLDAVHAFWTPDRLRRAKSLDDSAVPGRPAGAGTRPAGFGTASTAATKTVANAGYVPTALPPSMGLAQVGVTSTVGRLFFNDSTGALLSCSASTVTSSGQSMVMTAGHCVFGGPAFVNDGTRPRGWYSNVIYFPGAYVDAYGGFQAPYGGWAAVSIASLIEWIGSADTHYDVGVVIAETHSGLHLVTKVGGNGLTWDQPAGLPVRSYGYPGTAIAERLRVCTDTYMLVGGGGSWADMQCDMGHGGSGGPWLVNQDAWGMGYITGVNSWQYDDPYGHTLFSPYFSSRVVDLYTAMRTY